MATQMSSRQLRDALLITCIPVAVALLMQRPALRQQFVMQVTHYAKEFCQVQADFWQKLATGSAQAYNKARL